MTYLYSYLPTHSTAGAHTDWYSPVDPVSLVYSGFSGWFWESLELFSGQHWDLCHQRYFRGSVVYLCIKICSCWQLGCNVHFVLVLYSLCVCVCGRGGVGGKGVNTLWNEWLFPDEIVVKSWDNSVHVHFRCLGVFHLNFTSSVVCSTIYSVHYITISSSQD